jgi:hypothetical protein
MANRLMSFVEFRTAEPEMVREQREHFRSTAAAEALLQPGALAMRGWPKWEDPATEVPV